MPCDLFRERIVLRFTLVCAVAISAVGTGSFVVGQTEPPPSAAPDSTADNPPPIPEFRFSVAWVSTGGSYLYVPEKWGELHINLINSRDQPRELLCTTYFDEQPTLQFGRRVWMPAKSAMRISHPVLIPQCDARNGRSLNLHSLVLDASEGDEILLKNDTGQLLRDGTLLVTHSLRNTGVIDVSRPDIDVPPKDVSDLIVAGRVGQQLNNKFALLLDMFLSPDESGLNALDHIVIAENRIADDFAALSAVRHWLNGGGHLWVMLDRADPVVLEKLLGDDFAGHIVDRVGLNSVRVDKAGTLSDPSGVIGEPMDYDDPVDLVRMTVSNVDVTHSVNGWPAAMTKPYGDGRILITTLGPRGWMKPRPPGAKESNDPAMRSAFITIAPMNDIAAEFFSVREPALLPQTALESQVREYVGYTIPSWGLIVGTLGCFTASLAAVGIWLLRTGRLEYLGGIGSIIAVAVSIVLLLVGRSYRHGVPGTVASVQVAQAIAGTDDVRSQGVVAVYQPEGSSAQIRMTQGGQMLPDMSGLESTARRMVTTDFGAWHWEHLPQPAGLRSTQFARAETVVDRMEAHATLDTRGIVGRYSGRLAPGTDALVATRVGRIGVTFQGDGAFVAGADDVFEKEQYLGAGLISDEQDRRRRTLEKLLANPKRKDYPDRPQLMFWSDGWDHGFDFGDDLKTRGATLVAVPLNFDRPPTGTEFVIPSPLLPYRNQNNPDGSPTSTMWNYGRKEWQERSTPGTAWLNFRIPRELLPLTASRARIDLKVSGPIGRIEILGLKRGTITSLETIVDPVGALSFEVTDADVLSIADDGGMVLGLSGGDPKRPELTQTTSEPGSGKGPRIEAGPKVGKIDHNSKVNYWRIESLTLQLWAKTTEPTAKD